MSLIENTIRPEIRALAAYHVPDATGYVKLDAMENPCALPEHLRSELGLRLAEVALNRYPVPSYLTLKAKICEKLGVPAGFDVVLGNGSDELISIISTACAKPGGKVLSPTPSFVMYARSAQFAGLEFIGVPLKPDFSLDKDAMLKAIAQHRPAVTYLSYPNNPTGNLFDTDDMVEILHAVGDTGLVVVDEAYQPFAQASFMSRLREFSNLIVMRTVSKLGLAGIRLGYMTADSALLAEFDKVRPPYNINVLTQAAAEFVLDHNDVLDAQALMLRNERSKLSAALTAFPDLEVFPSAGNFLLIRLCKAGINSDEVANRMAEHRVLIKNVGKMHSLLNNCLRITVSTSEENRLFLDALTASLAP
ncbi:MAG: histidinol-phosphate transaminase [Burkholderiales bacterium RIFCSPLOWO2_02_FULL_57_36]|nr:MAG: histidinol-phosphate transaminase [Burkholderiales bacterium RIFCSPLOWO2_02_FULL_57_36]